MARLRTSSDAELFVELRRDDGVPLHRQLELALRERICKGRLAAGTVLPSTRALAADLGLSRGVVIEAYEQLTAEGYLTTRPGGATQVAECAVPPPPPMPRPEPMAPQHRIDFRYGRPDVSQFPRAAWLRSLRRVLNTAPAERFSYLDGRGAPELRSAMASYLNRVRGTNAHEDHILVTTGFGQALNLITTVLRASGARVLAVENPSNDDAPGIAASAGLEVVGIGVDELGI